MTYGIETSGTQLDKTCIYYVWKITYVACYHSLINSDNLLSVLFLRHPVLATEEVHSGTYW